MINGSQLSRNQIVVKMSKREVDGESPAKRGSRTASFNRKSTSEFSASERPRIPTKPFMPELVSPKRNEPVTKEIVDIFHNTSFHKTNIPKKIKTNLAFDALEIKKKSLKVIFFDFYFIFNRFFRSSKVKTSALKKFYARFCFLRLKMLKTFFSRRRFFSFQKLLNTKKTQDTKGVFLKNIIRIQNNILNLFNQLQLYPRKFSVLVGKLLREYSTLFSIWCDLDKYGTFDRDLPVRQRRLMVKYYTKPGYFKTMYRDQRLVHKVIPFKYLIKQPKRGFYLKSLKITDHLFFWHAFTRKKLQQSFWLVRGKKFLKHFFSLKFTGFFSKIKKFNIVSLSLKNIYVHFMNVFLRSIQNFFLNTNVVIPEKKWESAFFVVTLPKIPFQFLLDSMLLQWKFFVHKLSALYNFEINRSFGFMLNDCFGISKILFGLFSKQASLLNWLLFARANVQFSLRYFFMFLFNNVFFSKFIQGLLERGLCDLSVLKHFEYFRNDIYFFGNKKEKC